MPEQIFCAVCGAALSCFLLLELWSQDNLYGFTLQKSVVSTWSSPVVRRASQVYPEELPFFRLEDAHWEIWQKIPKQTKQNIVKKGMKDSLDSLIANFMISPTMVTLLGPSTAEYNAPQHACRCALGEDVALKVLGSQTRATCAANDSDLDLQVFRSSDSKQANEPFTQADVLNVANHLRDLPFVSGVRIGSIAIKFRVGHAFVDLVLWKGKREEEFPRLRGGHDFENNSASINAFLARTPAARCAISSVKLVCRDGRPKGILLEAIAWRLWETVDFPRPGGDEDWTKDCVFFFFQMVVSLRNWETCPAFASKLRHDLSMLSQKQRRKYVAGFKKLRNLTSDEFFFRLFSHGVDWKFFWNSLEGGFFNSHNTDWEQMFLHDAMFHETIGSQAPSAALKFFFESVHEGGLAQLVRTAHGLEYL